MWLVLLEAERIKNRITWSDKSFALPKSVSVYSYIWYPHWYVIPLIKNLNKNPKWLNVNYYSCCFL